ncbi:MAG TPA: hypothetical protein VF883_17605 [Thermoanaerobaculia bacterium]
MFTIAILKDEDPLLTLERERIVEWAPANGWQYIEYADAVDLLARLTDLNAESIREVEIVAHGNPAECDDIRLESVRTLGESLRRVNGFSRATVVYLSGCNTGLQFGGDCVARFLAESAQATVCGARGYLAGTHAERNERCVASFSHAGIMYEAYDDAIDASGDDVWRRFGPPLKAANGDDMEIKISTSGFRPVNLTGEKAAQLRNAVEEAIQQPAAEPAPFRIAPDLRFAIRLSDGEHIFELLAGGTVLRDPVTRRVWQLRGGRALLESLWPFRNGAMPAA